MTGPGEAAAPRRILVALEAGESAPALLEAAANLAAGLHAELVGLFVEDRELLDAADLPVTRSIPALARPAPRKILPPPSTTPICTSMSLTSAISAAMRRITSGSTP